MLSDIVNSAVQENDGSLCEFQSAALAAVLPAIRTHAVDHEVHDDLGHEVFDGLVDDADVGVHQVADGLHLPFQLRVLRGGAVLGRLRRGALVVVVLRNRTAARRLKRI